MNSYNIELAFPFHAFAKNHHKSKPDFSASFPGKTLTTRDIQQSKWEKVSFMMEVKPEKSQNPFSPNRAGQTHQDTIIQIARNARCLLLAHGYLAAFVVGIYGEDAHIARFDHSSCVVSPSFNIRTRPEFLQQFFWHFTHPKLSGPVVGFDPTVRPLEPEDKAWVKRWLEELEEEVTDFNTDIRYCRRVQVFDEKTHAMSSWIMYRPVDINARLFSRATTVWRAIEDTRVPDADAGGLIDLPDAPKPRLRILKESWRQVVRKSEASFYHRLSERIPEDERIGLTKLECGGDLGQWEVRQWEQSSPNVSCMDGQRDLRLSPGPRPSTPRSPSPSPSDTTLSSDGGSTSPAPPTPEPFPIPYPQHQTFSWTITRGSEFTYRERSHMRFVVADVGRPLTKAKNSRELVAAFRDAIEGVFLDPLPKHLRDLTDIFLPGHRLACVKGGVLHRDVSVGNILIVDKPERARFKGFIHDFDYSSMEEDLPDLLEDSGDPDDPLCDDDEDVWSGDESETTKNKVDPRQKERTVSTP